MSKIEKVTEELITPLLNTLRTKIIDMEQKRGTILYSWLATWIEKYLDWELTFDPTMRRAYERGDIVYANFGFKVGSEIGGVRYALVIENNNAKSNNTVTVIPLSSSDEEDYEPEQSDVILGKNIITDTPKKANKITVAKVNQICALSKLRIIKPKHSGHAVNKLSDPDLLDAIDKKIIEMYTKLKKC